jgi:hypothetical protein
MRQDVKNTSPAQERDPMFRKTILALAAVASLGAVFASTTASAHYYGYGYSHGYSYSYGHTYYRPYYSYSYGY